MIIVVSQAAEKQQENSTEHSASATTTSLTSTSTVTTTSSSTIMVSAEPACGARSKKTCSQSGKAVSCTMAVPTVSQSQCCSHSQPVKPSVKLSVERDPAVDKTIATQTSATSSLTTSTSPQISMKLAKGRRGQKIGQPQVMNSAKQTSTKQPVDTVPQANGMSVKCARSFVSDTLSTKSSTVSHGNTVSPLPNGLVSHTGKTAGKVEPQNNTASPPHGHSTKTASQLPNGLQVHASRNPSKTSLLAPTGSSAQCGSKMTNGHLDKTSRKTVAEETDSVTQSSVMDTGGQVNGHSDATTASTAAKSKKARRKGRGKEAQTSVG